LFIPCFLPGLFPYFLVSSPFPFLSFPSFPSSFLPSELTLEEQLQRLKVKENRREQTLQRAKANQERRTTGFVNKIKKKEDTVMGRIDAQKQARKMLDEERFQLSQKQQGKPPKPNASKTILKSSPSRAGTAHGEQRIHLSMSLHAYFFIPTHTYYIFAICVYVCVLRAHTWIVLNDIYFDARIM
jgi:hypothetical protein